MRHHIKGSMCYELGKKKWSLDEINKLTNWSFAKHLIGKGPKTYSNVYH
jgi:hypothetical protein